MSARTNSEDNSPPSSAVTELQFLRQELSEIKEELSGLRADLRSSE